MGVVHASARRRARTWTLERSGILAGGSNGFDYRTIAEAIHREGDMMKVIDVLANCMGLT